MSEVSLVKNLILSTGFSRADCLILMKAFKLAFKEEMIRTHHLKIQGLGSFKVKQNSKRGYYVRFYPETDFEKKLFTDEEGDTNETLFE